MIGGSTPTISAGAASSMIAVELALREPRRHRRRRRADLPRRDRRREELDAVREREHHDVALPHAERGERLGGVAREPLRARRASTVRCSSVTAGRSGSAAARSASRRGYEIRGTSVILPESARGSYAAPPCHSNTHLHSSPAAPRAWARPPPGASPPRARTVVIVDRDAGQGRAGRRASIGGTFAQADVTERGRRHGRGRGRGRARAAAHVHPLRGHRLGRAHDQPRRRPALPRHVPQDHRDQPHRHVQRAAARGVGHGAATSPTTTASAA